MASFILLSCQYSVWVFFKIQDNFSSKIGRVSIAGPHCEWPPVEESQEYCSSFGWWSQSFSQQTDAENKYHHVTAQSEMSTPDHKASMKVLVPGLVVMPRLLTQLALVTPVLESPIVRV